MCCCIQCVWMCVCNVWIFDILNIILIIVWELANNYERSKFVHARPIDKWRIIYQYFSLAQCAIGNSNVYCDVSSLPHSSHTLVPYLPGSWCTGKLSTVYMPILCTRHVDWTFPPILICLYELSVHCTLCSSPNGLRPLLSVNGLRNLFVVIVKWNLTNGMSIICTLFKCKQLCNGPLK